MNVAVSSSTKKDSHMRLVVNFRLKMVIAFVLLLEVQLWKHVSLKLIV